jgi:putative DNA primase/helicase
MTEGGEVVSIEKAKRKRRKEPPQGDPLAKPTETELQLGWRLAEQLAGRALFVPERGGWLLYDGGWWQADRREAVREIAGALIEETRCKPVDQATQRAAEKASTARGVSNILLVASSRAEVRRLDSELDAHPYLLNAENGTIDLRSGQIRAHDPADLLTCMAPSTYEPETAAYDDFARLLEQLAPDEAARAYLRRAIGYSITGAVNEDTIHLVIGPTRCGKSTLFHALRGALGPYYAAANMESFCVQNHGGGDKPRSDLVAMRLARLVVASEVRPGMQIDAGLVKSLAGGEGGERFRFRDLYGKSFEGRWNGKIWLVCNETDVPAMRSEDDAFWERTRRIPVGSTIAKEKRDVGLRERLERDSAARAAVLAWAVAGAVEWWTIGLGREPQVVAAAATALRSSMDPAAVWIALNVSFEAGHSETKRALREEYEKSAEDAGEKPISAKRFHASLKVAALRFGIQLSETRKRPTPGGKPADAWMGVRLLTDDEREQRADAAKAVGA